MGGDNKLKSVGKSFLTATSFMSPIGPIMGASKLGLIDKNISKAIPSLGGFLDDKEEIANTGIDPETQRQIQLDARNASFGMINAGTSGGKSREQLEQEIFGRMVSDFQVKQAGEMAAREEEELNRQSRIQKITASREAVERELRERPGTQRQSVRSRRSFYA